MSFPTRVALDTDTRAETIVVAASNSLDPTLAPAAYRCSGVNDEVEINAALVAAAAVNGSVELLEGDYNTVLTLSVAVNVMLKAVGWGAVINFNAGGNAVTIAGDNVKLRDFKVVIVAGAGGAGTRPNCVYAADSTNLELTHLWLVGDLTVANDGSRLRQCGIVFGDDVDYSKIDICTCQDHAYHGISLAGSFGNVSSYNTVVDNVCRGNDRDGIALYYSDNAVVVGNLLQGNTSNGISLYSSGHYITISGNICLGNSNGLRLDMSSNYNAITGNVCEGGTLYGIHIEGYYNTVTGNICEGNTLSGIRMDGRYITVVGNGCNFNIQHGIYVHGGRGSTVIGNICFRNDLDDTGTYDGICLTSSADDTTVMCNQCTENDRYGISIETANCDRNLVKSNILRDNTAGPFSDAGTDTKLATKTFQFIAGGDAEGIAVWASFVSANASAKGWSVTGADDWAVALGQLPLELQQVVRIKIWAVALGAPIGAGGQMHFDILINAGASNLAYTTETIGLVSFDGEEADYVATDVVHWLIDAGDDADLNDFVAGMSIECKVIYQAGDDPDGATNAVLRVMEIEYV